MKRNDIILLVVTVLIVGGFLLVLTGSNLFSSGYINKSPDGSLDERDDAAGLSIASFSDCVSNGFAVMESYPRQCRDDNGNIFVEYIGNELELTDEIRINYPRPNQVVTSPLEISGQAVGFWFFEGNFPVELVATHGKVIASGIAQAQGDWMTEDFVEFKAILNFDEINADQGELILERDNPSGLPANAQELRVPVRFNTR